jgi:hypothetical protein
MTFLDRIKETSTSTGTGAFTLAGAVTGYKVFSNGTYKYCIVNASETEWEVGEGTVTSGVLTRTTIEASSNGGSAVSFTAGTKYVFNTVSAAYVNSLVPYTGATASVNLGAYSITATNIIRAGGLATEFLKADGSVDSTTYMNRAVYDTDGNGVVDAAEKMQTIGRNATGATLYKGTIVYISGSTGNRPNFVKAQANSEATSAGTFGVVVSDIANNADGYVATIGTLADLDTRTTATNPFTSVTLADGDTIYLDPNTAGYVTNVKPSAPNHIVYVGKVVRTSPTLGTIVYRIQNGYELNEIHDVAISSVANNDVLVYESSTTLWKNKSISTVLGYTPQAAITLTTTGSSGASTFVSNTLNIPTYTLAGLGGQPQLNGTGFVKASGTTISYDNTTYATDSLVVHLAGAENITGVKTFQNALQTTVGNNLLNSGGGNTVIGYTADPASSATYKLDVNGQSRFVGNLLSFNGSNLRAGLYTSSGWGMLDLYYGSLAVRLDPSSTSYMCLGGANLVLGATTGNNSAILYLNSTAQGFRLPNMTTIQKNAIVSPATSLLVYDTDLAAFQYYTGSAWAGLGGGITGSGTAGQLTYWSGTSAVTGSSNLVWDATNSRLSIAAGASPAYRLQVHGSMRVGSTAASAMYWDDTNNRLNIGTTLPTTIATQNIFGTTTFVGISIKNNSTATGGTQACIALETASGSIASLFKTAASYTTYKIITGNDLGFYNSGAGDISIFNDFTTGNIKFASGGSSTAHMTIKSNGRINMSSLPTSSAGLSTGDLWNNLGIINIV